MGCVAEGGCCHFSAFTGPVPRSRGRIIVNVVPCSLSERHDIVPPADVMILDVTASPMPVPDDLVVNEGLNICPILSSGIPEPLSDTVSTAWPEPSSASVIDISGCVPDRTASMAFFIRLDTICTIAVLSRGI